MKENVKTNPRENADEPERTAGKDKREAHGFLHRLTRPQSGKGLALRIVLSLVVPYVYLLLCGLVFDRWLRMYSMTTFIFFSYVTFALIGLIVLVASIVNYVKMKKRK